MDVYKMIDPACLRDMKNPQNILNAHRLKNSSRQVCKHKQDEEYLEQTIERRTCARSGKMCFILLLLSTSSFAKINKL